MAAEEVVQLTAGVSDDEKFALIEGYRARRLLWDKSAGGTREAIAEAWASLTASVSTPGRPPLEVNLVQKLVKNLRDNYVRLRRRGTGTSWKFYDALSFLDQLGAPASPPAKRKQVGEREPPAEAPLTPSTSRLAAPAEPSIPSLDPALLASSSALLLQSMAAGLLRDGLPPALLPLASQPFTLPNLPELMAALLNSAAGRSALLPPVAPPLDPNGSLLYTPPKSTPATSNTCSPKENVDVHLVQLHEIKDEDRFRLVELYHARPILWCKRTTAPKEAIAAAWDEVVREISTPTRRFSAGLVQKLLKNLRDQYLRLKRRHIVSSWKFLPVLSFLDSESVLSNKRPHSTEKKEEDEDDVELDVESTTPEPPVDPHEPASKQPRLGDRSGSPPIDRPRSKPPAFQSISNLLMSSH
ncbi:MADF domain-containing protein [Aphelenchoides fujianensis]|nr:MADF domain-containing protein [Aphelenchoides fujianensis]